MDPTELLEEPSVDEVLDQPSFRWGLWGLVIGIWVGALGALLLGGLI